MDGAVSELGMREMLIIFIVILFLWAAKRGEPPTGSFWR